MMPEVFNYVRFSAAVEGDVRELIANDLRQLGFRKSFFRRNVYRCRSGPMKGVEVEVSFPGHEYVGNARVGSNNSTHVDYTAPKEISDQISLIFDKYR